MTVSFATQALALDPLGHAEPLPLTERFFPAGFPLTLRTNAGEVLEAAREGWGEYEPAFETPPLELRVVVRGGGTTLPPEAAAGPVYRAQGHLLAIVLGPENFAACDLDRGLGFAWLTPPIAADPLYTSFYFLDALAYACLTQQYLTPIHAACVARGGEGILLAGGPGAGKSSLAWACARAGLTYVCDDASWLLRGAAEPTILGKPQRLRFRPEALDLVPELRGIPRLKTVIGKRSFEIRPADVPGLATARRCRAWRLVFLDRRDAGPAELAAIDAEEAEGRLAALQPHYETRVADEHAASAARLVARGAQVLRYGDLAGAVERILSLK